MKFGSASVPVYRCQSGKRVRFVISYYRDGRRLRLFFGTLDAARKEAQLVAQRIQSGMQHVTDLAPHDRDAYVTACRMLEGIRVPLVAAIEDYVRARQLAGNESLAAMAAEYLRHFGRCSRRGSRGAYRFGELTMEVDLPTPTGGRRPLTVLRWKPRLALAAAAREEQARLAEWSAELTEIRALNAKERRTLSEGELRWWLAERNRHFAFLNERGLAGGRLRFRIVSPVRKAATAAAA